MIDLRLFNKVETYKVCTNNINHLHSTFKYQFIQSIKSIGSNEYEVKVKFFKPINFNWFKLPLVDFLNEDGSISKRFKNLNISLRVEELREQTKKAHAIDRDRMVKYNLRLVEAWEELWELGKKENKTKEEIQRFYLCKDLVKGSDYKSCLAEISKLTGLYQPEKVEIKDTSHTTEWG
jgi:hypothetical protein